MTLFVSDHGEHLYDTTAGLQGHGMPDLGPVEVEIPLLAWASRTFAREREETWKALAGNRKARVSSADMFFGMADLMGVRYPEMRPSKSFARADYQARSREVLTVHGTVVLPYDQADLAVGAVQ